MSAFFLTEAKQLPNLSTLKDTTKLPDMKQKRKNPERECQPCTGCCDGWVQMVIDNTEIFPGSPCPHSTSEGCSNYENRPTIPCRNFSCGWITPNSPLPEWMKPSNSKTIILLNTLSWQGLAVDLAVPMGKKIPPRALNWLQQFSEEHYRPLIYATQTINSDGKFQKQQQLSGYGPQEFQEQLIQWNHEGKKLW